MKTILSILLYIVFWNISMAQPGTTTKIGIPPIGTVSNSDSLNGKASIFFVDTLSNQNIEGIKTFGGTVNVDNIKLDGNTISSTTGDLDFTSASGGVYKFDDNSFRSGLSATEYLDMGHGGANAFIDAVGDGGVDFRFEGATLATFTDFGHLHLTTTVDQKHNLKIKTSNNANASGIAWENSGSNFSQTIFREDVGSNRSDLVFAIGSNANIDLLTNSFRIHGSAANEGRLEILDEFQISSGTPGVNKVLTSDATGLATWQAASAGGWVDDGTVVRLATSTDAVGIGTALPFANGLTIANADPHLYINETGVTADNGLWDILAIGENLLFRAVNDANSVAGTFMEVDRTGTTINDVLFPNGNIGIGLSSPESDIDQKSIIAQVDWSSDELPYGLENFNLVLERRHSTTNDAGLGFAGPAIDFRANNAGGNIFSLSQIVATVDPNGGSNFQGGLAFLTSGGGVIDPAGRRTDGSPPTVRMVIDALGRVGIGETAPDNSALLELTSTARGFLPPRMTTVQIDAISSPANGLIVFDTDKQSLRLRKSSGWQYFSTGIVKGQFSHNISQKPSVTTPVNLNFDQNDIPIRGLSHSTTVDNEEFTATIQKSFTFLLAPRWERTTTGGNRTIDFFIQLSTDAGTVFTNVAQSNVKAKAGSNDSNVIPLEATLDLNIDDIVRFQMRISATGDGLGTVFTAAEVGPPPIPVTPAQILTIHSGD